MLSDAHLRHHKARLDGSRAVCLEFGQSIKHFEYFWHVYSIFRASCANYPHFYTNAYQKLSLKLLFIIRFRTRFLDCFSNVYSDWYVDHIKVLPKDLFDNFTAVSLAHWIKGDGGIGKFGGVI
jgi:hypothetical protein